MKLFRTAVLFVALSAAGCAGLTGHLEPPTVSVVGVSDIRLSLQQQKLTLTLRISNPNATALDVESLALVVDIAGHHFADLATTGPALVPAQADLELPVSVSVATVDLLTAIDALRRPNATGIDYHLSGSATLGPFHRKLTLDRSGKFTPRASASGKP